MRRVVLAAVVVAVALGAVAAGGGKGEGAGPLRWNGKALAFTHPTLPTDHVVTGRVRDESLKPLRVVARRDFKVVTADGTPLPTSAVFTQTFGHALLDPTRVPYARLPERELMRIGDVGRFKPGDELPVTISWREAPGGPAGARVEYPGGILSIPREVGH